MLIAGDKNVSTRRCFGRGRTATRARSSASACGTNDGKMIPGKGPEPAGRNRPAFTILGFSAAAFLFSACSGSAASRMSSRSNPDLSIPAPAVQRRCTTAATSAGTKSPRPPRTETRPKPGAEVKPEPPAESRTSRSRKKKKPPKPEPKAGTGTKKPEAQARRRRNPAPSRTQTEKPRSRKPSRSRSPPASAPVSARNLPAKPRAQPASECPAPQMADSAAGAGEAGAQSAAASKRGMEICNPGSAARCAAISCPLPNIQGNPRRFSWSSNAWRRHITIRLKALERQSRPDSGDRARHQEILESLPDPPDPALFQRTLEIKYKPFEE